MNIKSPYDAAMSKVLPGTFVPDIAPGRVRSEPIPADGSAAAGGVSFKDTVKSMLSDVNDKLQTSDKLTRELATGQTNDINKVVTSVEEATLAMQFTLAIRNKLLQAYQEVSSMQV
jgi:flagellar hook-basal body complex protein FliE